MFKVIIKKPCDRIGTKVGEEYTAEKYRYDTYGKVFLKENGCFEYVYNLQFKTLQDKINFYK